MSQSVLHPRGLCGNELKLLAILAMTVDHIAWSLFPGYSMHPLALLMHAIGRLTCPIMCYFIAEGYHYTKSFQNYALRLLPTSFSLSAATSAGASFSPLPMETSSTRRASSGRYWAGS